MELEIRHLRLVRTIASIGTATGASREIGGTQSALSQQLLDLEARLGERLFERTGRRMLPTPFAVQFLERGQALLDEMARLRGWLLERRHETATPIRISVDNVLTLRWIPEVLTRFRSLHPAVPLRIQRSAEPLVDLGAGRLDLAITPPPKSPDPAIEILPLFEDELMAVLPPSHRLAGRRIVALADLANEDFLYHMELARSRLQRRYLGPTGTKLRSVTVIENPEVITELVAAGLGVTLLPRQSVAREAAQGTLVARPLVRGRGGYRIAWSAAVRRDRDTPWVDEIVALLRSLGRARR